MTHRERYLKVWQEREALASRIAGLPQAITQEKVAAKSLEEEAIRKELLEDDVRPQKKALDERRERIRSMTVEYEDGKDRARMMQAVLEEIRHKAEEEMSDPARKRFAQGIRDFLRKLEEARKAEADLVVIWNQVREEYDSIGSRAPIDSWEPVLLRALSDSQLKVSMSDFVDLMKARGLY